MAVLGGGEAQDDLVRASTSAMGRRPAITDVAKVAGVSLQTVSRVLNGHLNVTPKTRERVLAAIDQLAYRRNTAARALVTGRSRVPGIVTLDTSLYGPTSMLYGIERAARDAQYFVSVASVSSVDLPSMRAAVERLAGQGVDGIVAITPTVTAATALTGLSAKIPMVTVDGEESGMAGVSVDQRAGAAAAVSHLLDAGHPTVWHVAGPAEWFGIRADCQR